MKYKLLCDRLSAIHAFQLLRFQIQKKAEKETDKHDHILFFSEQSKKIEKKIRNSI